VTYTVPKQWRTHALQCRCFSFSFHSRVAEVQNWRSRSLCYWHKSHLLKMFIILYYIILYYIILYYIILYYIIPYGFSWKLIFVKFSKICQDFF